MCRCTQHKTLLKSLLKFGKFHKHLNVLFCFIFVFFFCFGVLGLTYKNRLIFTNIPLIFLSLKFSFLINETNSLHTNRFLYCKVSLSHIISHSIVYGYFIQNMLECSHCVQITYTRHGHREIQNRKSYSNLQKRLSLQSRKLSSDLVAIQF